ncbi:MAG: esterase family protein [Paludibacteraceae bacterium]|nr:esterase family protein [Paludibacteraceae bacterium]
MFQRIIMILALCLPVVSCRAEEPEVRYSDVPQGTVIRDVTINSTVLNRSMKYSVYLPAGYTDTAQYPVIYLLHGYGGDQNDWWTFDDIAADADEMIAAGEVPELIIVTPDGGTWMYIDNCYNNGIYYEQYFFSELLPDVETRYSICRERSARMIGGFSMGGYGALRYGVMHNELFAYVYAMSSVIGGYGATDISNIIGNYPVSSLPGITLECGDRDYFTYDNRDFSALLTSLGIQHEHIERSGSHDWTFWSACSPKILRKAATLFSDTPSALSEVMEETTSSCIYSLTGARLSHPQKGLNIINGKKVLIY